MFLVASVSAVFLLAGQSAAISSARTTYADCVRDAATAAKTEKVSLEQLTPRMQQACDAERTKLKAALIAFDVKNGISRKQAGEDADLQLDDYYVAQQDRYEYELEVAAPKPK